MQEFGDRGRQTVEGRPSKVSYADGQEGWVAQQAMAFMGRCREEGRPFFLHVSLPKPHQCYTPAQEFWDLYDEANLTLPDNADCEMAGKAPNLRRAAERWRTGDWTLFEPRTFEAGRLRKLHGYLGSVSHVDFAVGEMLDWLDANGLGDETIVVYGADHGDYACEHGIMEKAPGICSDAITRIPFIWRWPGVFAAGHTSREIVESVDLVNTVSSLAGLEAMETADGNDISHLLRGEEGEVHEVGVTEFAWSKSVRKGNHRLVYYPPGMFQDEYPDGFGELYDLESDPWEMTNLYFDSAHQVKVREMERALVDWLVTTTRPATVLPGVQSRNPGQEVLRYGNRVNADGKVHPEAVRANIGRNYL